MLESASRWTYLPFFGQNSIHFPILYVFRDVSFILSGFRCISLHHWCRLPSAMSFDVQIRHHVWKGPLLVWESSQEALYIYVISVIDTQTTTTLQKLWLIHKYLTLVLFGMPFCRSRGSWCSRSLGGIYVGALPQLSFLKNMCRSSLSTAVRSWKTPNGFRHHSMWLPLKFVTLQLMFWARILSISIDKLLH